MIYKIYSLCHGALVNPSDMTEHNVSYAGETITYYSGGYTKNISHFLTTINKRHTFTGLTVKNNKCYCYPYNYLYVTNNAGNENIYKYEDFSSSSCIFRNELALCDGCSIQVIPTHYKGIDYNYDESIPLAKYPTCGWTSDSYINWLTQNAVNIPTQLTTGVISTGESFAKGDASGAGLSIASTISNIIGEFYSASLLPNITHGGNNGNINYASNRIVFTFREMRVKDEYMRIIDDYFTRFGYKINRLTSPNITGRTHWNYVEIGSTDSIGYGTVPSQYMNDINNACRRGVTIWHNHSNLGNYSLNNSISS